MKKLRPCPFCGSEDVKLWSGNWEGYAICLDCGAEGPKVEVDDAGVQMRDKIAAKLWGTRTHDDIMLDAAGEIEASADPCLQWLVRLLREEAGR